GGHHPHGDTGGAVRHRAGLERSAAARRQPRGHHHQRGRARRPVRRLLRVPRPQGARAPGGCEGRAGRPRAVDGASAQSGDAARALGHAHRYASWRQAPSEPAPPLEGVDSHRAAAVLSATLAQGPGWLPPAAVTALLACYGLAPAESVLAATPHDAGDAAKKLGGKVALKGLVAGLIRKSDAGAVRLDLEGLHEVEAAAKDIAQRMAAIGQKVQAFMVQRMAPLGVEMLVGVVQDRHFGPVVAVGAAGRQAELMKDAQVRLTPLGRTDAATMIRSLVTYPLLDGYRGATPVNVGALEDVLMRVAALADAHSEIADVDFNPVVVHEHGAVIVDARVRVEPVST